MSSKSIVSNYSFIKDFDEPKEISNNKVDNNDNIHLLNYFISVALFSFNAFHIKCMANYYGPEFSSQLFTLMRSIGTMLIGLYLSKYNNIKIIKYEEVQNKPWFLFRSYGNYFSFLARVISLNYLKLSTSQTIVAINPLFVIFFSYIFLKEKLSIRFYIGVAICLFGALLIFSSEKSTGPGLEKSGFELFLGITTGLFNVITLGAIMVGGKILANEGLTEVSQIYWIGLTNSQCAAVFYLIGLLIGFETNTNIVFMLLSFSNSIMFYYAQYYMLLSIKYIEVSKTAAISYFSVIFSFFLGSIFLGDSILFTDILGSLIIFGYNLYNAIYKNN